MSLYVVPVGMKAANSFVTDHHRHNKAVRGCKFCIGVMSGPDLVGVLIAGRPVTKFLDDGYTLEILRCCTDGTYNACSILYSRAARIGYLMGYTAVITYTLKKETGSSLRAVGAVFDKYVPAGSWNRPSRSREHQKVYDSPKIRWRFPVRSSSKH